MEGITPPITHMFFFLGVSLGDGLAWHDSLGRRDHPLLQRFHTVHPQFDPLHRLRFMPKDLFPRMPGWAVGQNWGITKKGCLPSGSQTWQWKIPPSIYGWFSQPQNLHLVRWFPSHVGLPGSSHLPRTSEWCSLMQLGSLESSESAAWASPKFRCKSLNSASEQFPPMVLPLPLRLGALQKLDHCT